MSQTQGPDGLYCEFDSDEDARIMRRNLDRAVRYMGRVGKLVSGQGPVSHTTGRGRHSVVIDFHDKPPLTAVDADCQAIIDRLPFYDPAAK